MVHVERSGRLPSCSRCGGDLITSVVMPQDDESGRPIHLELCAACDRDGAASALVAFFRSGGGNAAERAAEGAELLMAWTKQAMAAHGWVWLPKEADLAGLEQQRDALRQQIDQAPPGEREQLQQRLRELSQTLATALAAHDPEAETLRKQAPQPTPGPLTPEAEQRILDFYQQLLDEQASDEP